MTRLGVPILAVLCAFFAEPTARAGSGSDIQGKVVFRGKAPTAAVIDMSSAPQCAGKVQRDETVVVNDNGTLRDVHVRIQSGTAGTHPVPAQVIAVDQIGCVYRPRVVGAMAGQSVRVTNSDPLMHNVHGYRNVKRTAFNRPHPAGAAAIEVKDKLGKAGSVFTLKCDVHPWMVAYVPLTDHPYFDVTGDTGAFKLKGVPAGTYTVEAWHPKYGLKQQTAKPGDTLTFSFP